jgi:uncharacterized protein (DUF3084 family)
MSWLRWYDKHGNWILTSTEEERKKAEQEKQKAEQERRKAEQERQKLEQERQKTERLIAQLRALGVEPDL